MARSVQVHLVDDIDGSRADETLSFGLDGTTYDIDLSTAHAKKLRSALAPFIAAGRRTGRPAAAIRRRSTTGGLTTRASNQAIRDWAKRNKLQLSDRGRIPQTVIARYQAEAGQ